MSKKKALATAASVILIGLFTQFALASTTAILLPKSDGNYKQFIPSTSTSVHYTMVNEASCNGTTNYNKTSTSTKRDSYGISVTSIGDGAIISQIAIAPCESRNTITTSTPVGSATTAVFYRWNGVDSSDFGTTSTASSITPTQLATSTLSGLSLFKTSTSVLEIGATYATGTKGLRLSRIAAVVTYTLNTPTAASSLVSTNSSSSVNALAWADNSNNELGFKIYRALNNGALSQVATTTLNATSYNDTALTADQTYTYQVASYNSAGQGNSNTSTAITYNAVPSDPSSLTTTVTGTNVILNWTDNSTNEDGFSIERRTDTGSFSVLATTTLNTAGGTVSYTDVGAVGTYYYRVRAFNKIGNSGYANVASKADTVTVSGNISVDTTWDSSHVYILEVGVTVVTGVKLTVNPGTVVKFHYTSSSLLVAGTLVATGTSASKIYFTSNNDDTIGSDTNGSATTAPAANDWNAILFSSSGSSTITYAVIRYGGYPCCGSQLSVLYNNGATLALDHVEVGFGNDYGIYQDSGTSTISNSDIHDMLGEGVHLEGGAASISSSTIRNNSSYGLLATGSGSNNPLTLTGNTFSGNGFAPAYIIVNSYILTHSGNTASGPKSGFMMDGAITANQTWTTDTMPYILVQVTVTTGTRLTVNSGSVVKSYSPSSKLAVAGTLDAEGTTTNTIYFTSIKDDSADGLDTNNDATATTPAAADWDAIQLTPSGSSTISHAVIRYGGLISFGLSSLLYNGGGNLTVAASSVMATGTTYGIFQESGTTAVSNSDIHKGGSYGIYIQGGTASVLSNSSIYDNGGTNIYNAGGTLTVLDSQISTSTTYGVYQSSGTSTIVGSDIYNSDRGIEISGGTLTVTSTRIHNNNRGVSSLADAVTVFENDIYSNDYGIYVAGGHPTTIRENAIHGNVSNGLYNLTATTVSATSNWWGHWLQPSWCEKNICSDSASGSIAGAYFDPWHHDDSWRLVNNFGLIWSSTSTYANDIDAAVFNWNSATTGMGIIPLSSTSSVSGADVAIYDTPTTVHSNLLGRTTGYPLKTIELFNLNIDQAVLDNNGSGNGWMWSRWVPIHELGHALGLGHSDPYGEFSDIMFSADRGTIAFGIDDKSDYNFLWNIIKWAMPNL